MHSEVQPLVMLDVSDIHFEDYQSSHEIIDKQMREIYALQDQADNIGVEVNTTIINGKPITWKLIAVVSSGSTSYICMFDMCLHLL